VRRILVTSGPARTLVGILTGYDLTRVLAD